MPIESVNPTTGQVMARYDALEWSAIDSRLARAADTFRRYRKLSFSERSARLSRLADLLGNDAARHGRLLTLEMGKTIKAAIAEVKKCASGCRYYAERGEEFLRDEMFATAAAESYVRYEPLGVILAIMPWNFPLWQAFRFAAPAVMAGNVFVLKHASNVPQSALLIEKLFRDAGFEDGVAQTLLIGSQQVARVIEDDRIAAVTLTGSEAAGAAVASRAGKSIKKAVLELGGSDPFIVMPSADVDRAARTAVTARTINNGQSCIAAKRFIIHRDIAESFLTRFTAEMARLKVGDPLDESVDIGPLATSQIADDLEKQVNESVSKGARVLCGGKRLGDRGNFFEPTILADIPDDSPAAREELFGPVASVFVVDGIDAAIARANATRFGLGSSVWTNDPDERLQLVQNIEAGQVFVNAMVASDPKVPFGGVKKSGYGRELSIHGIREFVNAKTVWIEESPKEKRAG